MSLAERGLLFSMRLECWVNKDVPSAPLKLAKYLGQDEQETANALTSRVKFFFLEQNGLYTSPELENYRVHLDEIKAKQSERGKKGAATVNRANKAAKQKTEKLRTNPKETSRSMLNEPTSSPTSKPPSNSASTPQVTCESLVKQSPVKPSQDQSSIKGSHAEWLDEFNNYDEASNGA